jgi:hypothetical protein
VNAWEPDDTITWYRIVESRYGTKNGANIDTNPWEMDVGQNPLLDRQRYHPRQTGWITREEYLEYEKVKVFCNLPYSLGTREIT